LQRGFVCAEKSLNGILMRGVGSSFMTGEGIVYVLTVVRWGSRGGPDGVIMLSGKRDGLQQTEIRNNALSLEKKREAGPTVFRQLRRRRTVLDTTRKKGLGTAGKSKPEIAKAIESALDALPSK